MSRYIDADALKYYGNHIGDEYEDKYHDAQWVYRSQIDTALSIDIVRCKECRWRGEQTESGIPYYWCRLVGVGYEVPIEHYCSYGEREGE